MKMLRMHTIIGAKIFSFAASDAFAGPADDMADGVELYFIKHFPEWGAVRCRDAEIDGQHFVYCRSSFNTSTGGLFLLHPDGTAYAVNGKAMQWAERGEATLVDGTPLPLERWTGEAIDIPAAIKALGG